MNFALKLLLFTIKYNILGNKLFFIRNIQIKYSGPLREERLVWLKIRQGYLEELTRVFEGHTTQNILWGYARKGVSDV